MGLIAGISVISLVEVLYQFFCNLCSCEIRSSTMVTRISVAAVREREERMLSNQARVSYKVMNYISSFVQNSSVHGISYIMNKDQNLLKKLFWLIAVLLSVVTCSVLIIDERQKADLNPTLFSIDEVIWNVKDVS